MSFFYCLINCCEKLFVCTDHYRQNAQRTGPVSLPAEVWQKEAEAVNGHDSGRRRSGKCKTSDWACHITSAAGCLHSSGMC